MISWVSAGTRRPHPDSSFIPPGASARWRGLPYTLLSLVLGWWGIPWGPIFTVAALVTNLGGGQDLTAAVAAALVPPVAPWAGPLAPPLLR